MEADQLVESEFDFDLDTVKDDVEECLESAKFLGKRLEDLNENIVQYLILNTSPKQTKLAYIS